MLQARKKQRICQKITGSLKANLQYERSRQCNAQLIRSHLLFYNVLISPKHTALLLYSIIYNMVIRLARSLVYI